MLLCVCNVQIERVMLVPPVAAMMVKSSQKHSLNHLKDLIVSGAPLKADIEDLLLTKYPALQLRQGTHVLYHSCEFNVPPLCLHCDNTVLAMYN